MSKYNLVVLIAVLLVGAGISYYYFGSSRDGAIVAGDSGITGTVMLGPTCPVMKDPPDPQCADKPFSTKLVVSYPNEERAIRTFTSATDGTFTVSVPPGTYVIHSAPDAPMLPRCGSDSITVSADAFTQVAISCDTGIR